MKIHMEINKCNQYNNGHILNINLLMYKVECLVPKLRIILRILLKVGSMKKIYVNVEEKGIEYVNNIKRIFKII